ncbi:hypothetical protein DTL21_27645 [Bremerella cremea]|uniref:Uncharacterized protein n=1 Tax=Blastopirellula marina TaxID=124 RepID=A0A2S8FCB7_9BACT|nr:MULTISPECIES: DUF6786 family protein [Pirellulaceae]PQO29811.1 hypothetical protein C5Y83_27600 [Blastopirellula marina]RCS43113.1 hypothetical protein DTL21_27645 [Bremerella cremea]
MLSSFQDDLTFLETFTPIVLLQDRDIAVAIAPAYQGRVMTSTVQRESGPSFGWINRKVIQQGIVPEQRRQGTMEEHIYVFGGEERFWLGPEGGQFALFFEPGSKFEFSDWKTPAAIDTEPYEIGSQTDRSVDFSHTCTLTNFSGAKFKMNIERSIRLLDKTAIAETLQIQASLNEVQVVAYESDNRLSNRGNHAWLPESGLPSIWLLGMYNPSPQTTIVIPFHSGSVELLGPKVNDRYFGKVPEDYLKVEEDVLYLKGDGTRRGKIGLSPERSKGLAGSYDADGKVLTIVMYNTQEAPSGYVNSMWELQDNPFEGDVINAYNDGSPAPGEPPLGPFYELETSSPAAALKPGETMRHVQRTFHIQGEEDQLDPIAERLFGVGLKQIVTAFLSKS